MIKVRSYQSWDFKSIRATIIIIIGLGIFLYLAIYKPSRDSFDSENFNKTTVANVTQIEAKTTFSQGFDGLNEYTVGYIIHYKYEIDKKYYSGKYYIPNKSGNNSILRYLKNSIGEKSIDLRYNGSIPSESTLNISLIQEQLD